MKEKMQNRQSRWFQSQAKEWFSLIRMILGKEVKQSLVSIFLFLYQLTIYYNALSKKVYVVYPKMVRNIIIYPRIFLRFTDPILKLDNNRSESFWFNMYLSSTTMFSKVIMSFFAPRENSFTLYPSVWHNSMLFCDIISHKGISMYARILFPWWTLKVLNWV